MKKKDVVKFASKNDLSAIRFEKLFIKKISKLADKANKKEFGRKIKPRLLIKNLLELADTTLLDAVIKKSQEDSLTQKDKNEKFAKENMAKFGGSKEKLEAKMLELMNDFLSQTH